MKRNQWNYSLGLQLPRQALRVLKERGIHVNSAVSLQHQSLAKRYVVRGVESGGAVGDIGRYVSFACPTGDPMEYLQPVDAIGLNGVHAVVVAPAVVRVDMLRTGRTYELLITEHQPGQAAKGRRPGLDTKVIFRGVHGRLELDLTAKHKEAKGTVTPVFLSLAGELLPVPDRFCAAVRALTQAVNCVGCSHCHFVRAPGTAARDRAAGADSATKAGPNPGAPERLEGNAAALPSMPEAASAEAMPAADAA